MFLFTLFSSHSHSETMLFGLFAIIIIFFLIIDLGFFNRSAKKISTKGALYQSIFWVFISTVFGYLIYITYDKPDGLALEGTIEYFSSYLTEKALSVDNIFVILLILKYFQVKDEYYHKILFWGILGAIVFRGLFIFIGALLIIQFHWILYLFGAFLIYSGIKIYLEDEHEKIDPENNTILKFCRKYLRITKDEMGGKFIVFIDKKLHFTPLFLVLVLVETTDVVFAVDSIPAAFAITQDEFLIYTSNIFAVLGLRAMFFLLAGIIDRFYLLQKGLSIILVFIGGKMLLEIFDMKVSPVVSFSVIIVTLACAIIFSILFPSKKAVYDDNLPTKG